MERRLNSREFNPFTPDSIKSKTYKFSSIKNCVKLKNNSTTVKYCSTAWSHFRVLRLNPRLLHNSALPSQSFLPLRPNPRLLHHSALPSQPFLPLRLNPRLLHHSSLPSQSFLLLRLNPWLLHHSALPSQSLVPLRLNPRLLHHSALPSQSVVPLRLNRGRMWNPAPGIRKPRCGIQYCPGLPYVGLHNNFHVQMHIMQALR